MARVLWHITMSMDGFIAGPGGDMSWMSGYAGPNPTVDEVLGKIGAVLIGNRTFGGDVAGKGAGSEEGRVYGGMWTGPQFVLTHRAPDDPPPGFAFVTDLERGIAAASEAAGDDKYVVILGASTARQCLDAGILDEILVHVAPILLGDGVRMFERAGTGYVRLDRLSVTQSPHVTNIWLRVNR